MNSPIKLKAYLWTAVMMMLPLGGLLGQFTYVENFKGDTAEGWIFGSESDPGDSTFVPALTASSAGGSIDSVGDGWLRLTNTDNNQANYAYLDSAIKTVGNEVSITFDYTVHGGDGADGITFFMFDASETFDAGAFGGSLGYANRDDDTPLSAGNGMAGGYFGLGIDTFGNYSNPTEGRNGGEGFLPDEIVLRGPGDGQTGYDYIAGTGGVNTTDGNSSIPSLGVDLQFADRPETGTGTEDNYYKVNIYIDPDLLLTVSIDSDLDGNFESLFTTDLSGFDVPDELKLGYTASTGGSTNIHEIRSLEVTTTSQPVGAEFWDSDVSDNWSDTSGSVSNWVSDGQPGNWADIFFGDDYNGGSPNAAEDVNIESDRNVRSINFDNAYDYTIDGDDAGDNFTIGAPNGGYATINVSEANYTSAGDNTVTHTIEVPITLDDDVKITNVSDSADLLINGDITTQNNDITVNTTGAGLVIIGGDVDGTSDLTKTGTGELVITGSTTYTGSTQIDAGTVTLNNSGGEALGGTSDITVEEGATLALGASDQIDNAADLILNGGTFDTNGYDETFSTDLEYGGDTTSYLDFDNDVSGSNVTFDTVIRTGTSDLEVKSWSGVTVDEFQVSTDPDSTTLANINFEGYGPGSKVITISSIDYIVPNNIVFVWDVDSNGDWDVDGNWLDDTAPGYTDANVLFGNAITSDRVVTLTDNETAGRLIFDNENTYTLNDSGGGETLTLDVSSGNAEITLFGTGSAVINTDVVIDDNLQLNQNSTGTLTINGDISESSSDVELIKDDDGKVVLGGNNSYGGDTTILNGILEITNGGALGDDDGDTTVEDGGTLALSGGITTPSGESLELNGTGEGGVGAMNNVSGDNEWQGSVSLASDSTINTTADSLTLSGTVSGSGDLTKEGDGTLVMLGNNTYSGETIIDNGILKAGHDNALGSTSGDTTVNDGGTLSLMGNITVPSGESLEINGTGEGGIGALNNMMDDNEWQGSVTLGSDASITSTADTLTLSGGIDNDGNDLTFDGAGDIDVDSDIVGTGGVTKNGSGTLDLSGDNSDFTGGLTINAGTVTATDSGEITLGVDDNNDNFLGAGAVTLNDGELIVTSTGDTVDLNGEYTQNSGTATFTSTTNDVLIEGNADIEMNGGALNINADDDLRVQNNADVTVTGGTVNIEVGGGSGNEADFLIDSNASWTQTGGTTTVDHGTGTGNNRAILEGELTVDGDGTVFYINTDEGLFVDDQGPTPVINLTNGGVLDVSGDVALDEGTLNGGGSNEGELKVGGDFRVDVSGGTATITGTPNVTMDGTGTQSVEAYDNDGALTGIGTFTQEGTSTTTLDSSITSFGAEEIVIEAGTLMLGRNDQVTNGTDMTLAGGTFATGGFDDTLDTLTLTADSVIDVSGGNSVINFSNSTSTSWVDGEILYITNWDGNFNTGGGNDQIRFGAGGLTEDQVAQIIFVNPNGTGEDYNAQILPGGEVVPLSVVPEPSTYFGGGFLIVLAGLHYWRKRRKTASEPIT